MNAPNCSKEATDLSLSFSSPLQTNPYHFTPALISVLPTRERLKKWLLKEGGKDQGGSAGPGGGGGTDVGRLALGRGIELAHANCSAKLLAKYVSPRHIRLLEVDLWSEGTLSS